MVASSHLSGTSPHAFLLQGPSYSIGPSRGNTAMFLNDARKDCFVILHCLFTGVRVRMVNSFRKRLVCFYPATFVGPSPCPGPSAVSTSSSIPTDGHIHRGVSRQVDAHSVTVGLGVNHEASISLSPPICAMVATATSTCQDCYHTDEAHRQGVVCVQSTVQHNTDTGVPSFILKFLGPCRSVGSRMYEPAGAGFLKPSRS
jgi:hypothetical protein